MADVPSLISEYVKPGGVKRCPSCPERPDRRRRRGPGLRGRARPVHQVVRVQHFHVAQYSSPFREPSDQATGVSMWMPEEPWPG